MNLTTRSPSPSQQQQPLISPEDPDFSAIPLDTIIDFVAPERLTRFKDKVHSAFTLRPRANTTLNTFATNAFHFLEGLQNYTPYQRCSHSPNCASEVVPFVTQKQARCFYKAFNTSLKSDLNRITSNNEYTFNSLSENLKILTKEYEKFLREENQIPNPRIQHLASSGLNRLEEFEFTLHNFFKSKYWLASKIITLIAITALFIYGIWTHSPSL